MDEIEDSGGVGTSFRCRTRVGLQNRGRGTFRVYVVMGFSYSWSQEVTTVDELLAAFATASDECGGSWSFYPDADIEKIETVSPWLADQLAARFDVEPESYDYELKSKGVLLYRDPRGTEFRLAKSDRGSRRLVVLADDFEEFVSRRIWKAYELGSVWYRLSPKYLLPRLQEVAPQLQSRMPEFAEQMVALDRAWEEYTRLDSMGFKVRISWPEFLRELAATQDLDHVPTPEAG